MHGQPHSSRVGMAGLVVMAVGAAVALSSPALASGSSSGRESRSAQASLERQAKAAARQAKEAARRAEAQQRRALEKGLADMRRSVGEALRELNGERRDFRWALEDLLAAGASEGDLNSAADASKASMAQIEQGAKERLEIMRASLLAGLGSPLSAKNQERLDKEMGKLNERLSKRLAAATAGVDEKLQEALDSMGQDDDDGLPDDPPGDD